MQYLFGNEIIDLDMHCEKERVRKAYCTGQSLVRIWNVLDVVCCCVCVCVWGGGVVCVVWFGVCRVVSCVCRVFVCGVMYVCGVVCVWCRVMCGACGHSRRSSFGVVLLVSRMSKRVLIPKTVSLFDFYSTLREIVFKNLAFPSKKHKSLSSALHRRS